MSRLPLLPKWVLPTPFPSLYDTESASPIEMVAKVYGAMNQLIEEYNSFVDTYNDEIRSFTSSSSAEIQNFKQNMEQRLQCKFNELDALFASLRLEMKQYKEQAVNTTTQMINDAIKNGDIVVAMEYNEETEQANIIVGGEV